MKDNAYYEPLLKLYAQVNELGFIPDYSVLASSSYTANDGLIVDASQIFAENAEKSLIMYYWHTCAIRKLIHVHLPNNASFKNMVIATKQRDTTSIK